MRVVVARVMVMTAVAGMDVATVMETTGAPRAAVAVAVDVRVAVVMVAEMVVAPVGKRAAAMAEAAMAGEMKEGVREVVKVAVMMVVAEVVVTKAEEAMAAVSATAATTAAAREEEATVTAGQEVAGTVPAVVAAMARAMA
jgi:hypothetical protein